MLVYNTTVEHNTRHADGESVRKSAGLRETGAYILLWLQLHSLTSAIVRV